MTQPPVSPLREIRVAPGRVLVATTVYDTYWRFATKRQEMFMQRVAGSPPPWSDDPVLSQHRFTNAYRASDRVSQYLIRNVLYEGPQAEDEVLFPRSPVQVLQPHRYLGAAFDEDRPAHLEDVRLRTVRASP